MENEKEPFSVRNMAIKKRPYTLTLDPDEVALVINSQGQVQVFVEEDKPPSKYGALLMVVLAAITDPKLFEKLLKDYGNSELIKKLKKGA
jgi:hypothetical protein